MVYAPAISRCGFKNLIFSGSHTDGQYPSISER
jgi:hypothetical protein